MHLHGVADWLRERSRYAAESSGVALRSAAATMDDGHVVLCDVCGDACSPHDAVTCGPSHHLCGQHESCLDCRECNRAAEDARQERLAEDYADEWRRRVLGRAE